MIGTYRGVTVLILGYMGEKILIRHGKAAPEWVAAEFVK